MIDEPSVALPPLGAHSLGKATASGHRRKRIGASQPYSGLYNALGLDQHPRKGHAESALTYKKTVLS